MCSFILDLYISINKRPKESRISFVSGYIDEMLGGGLGEVSFQLQKVLLINLELFLEA